MQAGLLRKTILQLSKSPSFSFLRWVGGGRADSAFRRLRSKPPSCDGGGTEVALNRGVLCFLLPAMGGVTTAFQIWKALLFPPSREGGSKIRLPSPAERGSDGVTNRYPIHSIFPSCGKRRKFCLRLSTCFSTRSKMSKFRSTLPDRQLHCSASGSDPAWTAFLSRPAGVGIRSKLL